MSGTLTPALPRSDFLETIRAQAPDLPADTPTSITLSDLTIHYLDAPSLNTAYKDIFLQRIYHFNAESESPTIIDGGAHIGLATLYWKQQYPLAQVTCFEPDETALNLLRRNLTANGITDVRIIEAGLSDRVGAAAFTRDGADGGRMTSSCNESATDDSPIRTVRLSEHLTRTVDLLKLNIEGQEGPVLHDLEQTGRINQVRRILLEYHGWPDGRQGLGDILNLLDRCGFRYILHDFDRETNPTTKPPFRIRSNAPWFCLVYAERDVKHPTVANQEKPAPVDWGELRRMTPVSRVFGLDRGTPVDRYYIERFLEQHSADIQGRVLEIADATYTRRFGGQRVRQSDVLHADDRNRHATIIGDLTTGAGIPKDAFDCIVLTQTLHCIDNILAAIINGARALVPGGVLLATLPGISQISRYDMERWGDRWRFTSISARRLFVDVFGSGNVSIETHGNVLAATAFLQGISVEELTTDELDHHDPDYELVMTVRAVRGQRS